ncbi:MAG: 16S rRNA (guanine(527)-N(7))-methyltransferase RsmG [bacterium]|nr:16S rRNA (guanine(527)-N(7))-methyltransferase RsmG [bacterium]
MEQDNVFLDGLKELNITLSDEQIAQFHKYYEMLVEKNKVMNLTAITEWNEVVHKHFLDSIAIVKTMDMSKAYRILDLGTGAGFPGIPLKIAFPQLEIVLLDSLNKRILFLQEVIDELGLQKITAIHGRAEDYAKQKEYRETFDLCVSRAVANLSSLSEYCLPYVKKGGAFVSYKSQTAQEETVAAAKAIHILGGKLESVTEFELPGTDMNRCFVKIDKVIETPKKYPRSAGKPTKEPL